ncbi:hypothetical protein KPH14_008977 [Odynerus spinipes]|uniref:Uncharacterized protein n=1 Tax=Odynerus spinipes TaxID=1348599 RepID=A0AAD9RNT7_9HYME|nr:hypothetical protein KPH14_008977 [Odynerus spinipes]
MFEKALNQTYNLYTFEKRILPMVKFVLDHYVLRVHASGKGRKVRAKDYLVKATMQNPNVIKHRESIRKDQRTSQGTDRRKQTKHMVRSMFWILSRGCREE